MGADIIGVMRKIDLNELEDVWSESMTNEISRSLG